jgi:signal transduction histidine kinase
MSELHPRWQALRSSVFTKLIAVMLGMGLVIPVAVAGFFLLLVRPAVTASAEGLRAEYMELFAATKPDLAAARRAAARHHMAIRYEGPDGSFTTDEALPSVAQANERGFNRQWVQRRMGGGYRVVTQSDGSAYVFAWDFERDLAAAHDRMLFLLLALIGIIVLAGHALLRRALEPLHWLGNGVAALGEGNLEVSVRRKTNDEFGALTDAFNRMVDRVREMVRSRDQLLLDVSHELRSPLTRMKVALELGPDDEHKKRLSGNVAEMEAMVTELLELERLRQGKGLRVTPADLMVVVRNVVRDCEGQAPGVDIGPAPEKVVLDIDSEKVRRVLSNLLENACKYSLPDSAPVRISVSDAEHEVVLKVEDDGPGIPNEDLPRVLEPFFRVDRSRSKKTGGYGLGLSLCKRIMEAHGGTIAIENREGRGASVVLGFPKSAHFRVPSSAPTHGIVS